MGRKNESGAEANWDHLFYYYCFDYLQIGPKNVKIKNEQILIIRILTLINETKDTFILHRKEQANKQHRTRNVMVPKYNTCPTEN